jgi:hypothetical protein
MRFLIILLLLLVAGSAGADEEAVSDGEEAPVVPGTRECIGIARIDRTKIVNDSTILFYMLGPEVYVNNLPRRCNGLKRMDAFSYATSLTQLCSLDIIRGLRSLGGELVPGVGCGLGKFVPITPEQIELLLAEPELEPEPIDPEVQAVDPDVEALEDETPDEAPSD